MTIVPVILCGGSGTRLWPRSRKAMPKPFLPLVGERTLFEATLHRCADPEVFARPIVVTGAEHVEHVEAQSAPGTAIIVEPEAKNTAAAIALAAYRLPKDAIMLVCPSDHHIADLQAFTDAATSAASLASDGWLVAFGIEARKPETGFGYIKCGARLGDRSYRVERFVEKPDLATARSFLAQGDYRWNGGLFAFGAGKFIEELASHRPQIAALVEQAVLSGRDEGGHFHPDAEAFSKVSGESIDYAVMENTDRAAVVPVDMGWSDIGNWVALREACASDDNKNVAPSSAELIDCRNVMVESDGPRVSVVGLENVTIVVSDGEILVTSDAGAQKVGNLAGAKNQ